MLGILLLRQDGPGGEVAAKQVAALLGRLGVLLDGGQQVGVAGLEAVVGELAGHCAGGRAVQAGVSKGAGAARCRQGGGPVYQAACLHWPQQASSKGGGAAAGRAPLRRHMYGNLLLQEVSDQPLAPM